MFSDESLGRLKAAKEQIDNAQNSIRKGKSSTVKPAPAPKAAAAPAPAPAQESAPQNPAPAQNAIPKPAKPAFAGFDMSELESLTKAAEAEAEAEADLSADGISLADI